MDNIFSFQDTMGKSLTTLLLLGMMSSVLSQLVPPNFFPGLGPTFGPFASVGFLDRITGGPGLLPRITGGPLGGGFPGALGTFGLLSGGNVPLNLGLLALG